LPNNDLLPAKTERRTTSLDLQATHFISVNIIPPSTNPRTESRFTLAVCVYFLPLPMRYPSW
jgi:hypothetical protein